MTTDPETPPDPPNPSSKSGSNYSTLSDQFRRRRFAAFDRAFHKALPVGDMFAREKNFEMRPGEYRPESEPLAGAVDGVRTSGVLVPLPGVGCDPACEIRSRPAVVDEVTGDDHLTACIVLRSEQDRKSTRLTPVTL